jgi:hypothetical protein
MERLKNPKSSTCLAFALGISLLVATGCAPPPFYVHHKGLNQERFTRVGLRPEGKVLQSSNFLVLPAILKPGTKAQVAAYSSTQVEVKVGGVTYIMYPYRGSTFETNEEDITHFLGKYFVDREEDLKLDELGDPELTADVKSGRWIKGMTKAQVYASIGPPAFIDQQNPATNLSYETIMASDQWTYAYQIIVFVPNSMTLYFGDGKLQNVVGP